MSILVLTALFAGRSWWIWAGSSCHNDLLTVSDRHQRWRGQSTDLAITLQLLYATTYLTLYRLDVFLAGKSRLHLQSHSTLSNCNKLLNIRQQQSPGSEIPGKWRMLVSDSLKRLVSIDHLLTSSVYYKLNILSRTARLKHFPVSKLQRIFLMRI